MAGHSQFKNTMHRKGRQDAIRSKLFGKLAREITVAAKMGLPKRHEPAAARGGVWRRAPRACRTTTSPAEKYNRRCGYLASLRCRD